MENQLVHPDRTNDKQYRAFLQQVRNNEYVKIKNGLYIRTEDIGGGMNDISRLIPGGILCLFSAWSYYDLTSSKDDTLYVAIDRSRKVCVPHSYLSYKLVYQKPELLDIGVTSVKINSYDVRIYDRERCVCDAIKYRTKIGFEVMQEIMEKYIKSPERDILRLTQYAKDLRVYNRLETYMEVCV